jgi:hypothetical protein
MFLCRPGLRPVCRPGLRPVRITVLGSNFNGATARPYFSVAHQLERYAAIFPDKRPRISYWAVRLFSHVFLIYTLNRWLYLGT